MQFCHNSGGLIQKLFVLKLITSPLFSPTEKEHHICTFIPNLSKHIVGAGSLYMVVALSVERYLSISNSSQQDKVGKHIPNNEKILMISGVLLWLRAACACVFYSIQLSKVF